VSRKGAAGIGHAGEIVGVTPRTAGSIVAAIWPSHRSNSATERAALVTVKRMVAGAVRACCWTMMRSSSLRGPVGSHAARRGRAKSKLALPRAILEQPQTQRFVRSRSNVCFCCILTRGCRQQASLGGAAPSLRLTVWAARRDASTREALRRRFARAARRHQPAPPPRALRRHRGGDARDQGRA